MFVSGMPVAFWFLLAFGTLGAVRTPRSQWRTVSFKVQLGSLVIALVCAGYLHFSA